MTTQELLARYAELLNEFDPNAERTKEFLKAHQDDTEFLGLARISRLLKKSLSLKK